MFHKYAVYLNDQLDRVFYDWLEAKAHGRAMHYSGYEVRYRTYEAHQHVLNRIN